MSRQRQSRARWRLRLVVSVLVLVGLLRTESARGDAPMRLLIVSESGSALCERLCAELGALGFAASVVAAPGGNDPALALLEPLRREGAAAALWLRAADSALSLTLMGENGPIDTLVVERAPGVSDAMLAIQLVERIRPALLLLPARAPAMPAVAPAPAERPAALALEPASTRAETHPLIDPELLRPRELATQRAFLATELGLGIFDGARGLAPVSALAATVGVFLLPTLRIELLGLVPLQRMEVKNAAGRTLSYLTLVGLDLRLDLLRRGSFQLSMALGAALSILATETRLYAESTTSSKTSVTGCPYLRAGAAYAFTRAVALRAEAMLGVCINAPAITIEGDQFSQSEFLGLPWLAALLAVEATFPLN